MSSLFHRTSVRKFQDRPVEREKIERVLRAAMQAPSAVNQQPWEFFVVTNPEKKEALTEVTPYIRFGKKAPVIIVLAYRVHSTAPLFTDIDMAICTENLWFACDEEGLGGTMCGIAPVEAQIERASKILELPDDLRVFTIFPMGYPAEERAQQDRFDESRIHYVD